MIMFFSCLRGYRSGQESKFVQRIAFQMRYTFGCFLRELMVVFNSASLVNRYARLIQKCVLFNVVANNLLDIAFEMRYTPR